MPATVERRCIAGAGRMTLVRAQHTVGALGAYDAVGHQPRHEGIGQAGRLLGGRIEVRDRLEPVAHLGSVPVRPRASAPERTRPSWLMTAVVTVAAYGRVEL